MTNVLRRENVDTDTLREDDVKMRGEDGIPKPGTEASEETNPDLELLASQIVRK